MKVKFKSSFYLPIVIILFICLLSNNIIVKKNVLGTQSKQLQGRDIDMTLQSSLNVTVKEGEAATVKYSITSNEYKTAVQEAVFLVDVSSNMKDKENSTRGRSQFPQNVIVNIKNIVKESENELGIKINTRVGIIGYADVGYSLIDRGLDKDLSKVEMYASPDEFEKSGNNIIQTITDMNSTKRSINQALEKANSLLNGDGNTITQNRNKAIIIVSSGSIESIDSNIANKIKNNGYRIIMLDISNSDASTIDSTAENNLKDLTKQLANSGDYTYFEIKPNDSGALTSSQKERLALAENMYMKIIPKEYEYADVAVWKPSLKSVMYGSCGGNVSENAYKIENAKITFDLGGNFEVGDKATIEYNGKEEEVDIKDIGNNKVEIDISKFITYHKTEQGFAPDISNFNIYFNVTPIGKGGAFGKDEYGIDISNLSYTKNIAGIQSPNSLILETPVITTEERDKPQLGIKLNELKVNGISTKNYYNICPNDEVEFTYKITAEDLLVSDINEEAQKEIVMVLDTSSSMNFKFDRDENASYDKESRIYALKNSAKSFINKFNNVSNVKISIVPFSYYAGYKNGIKNFDRITDSNKNEFEKYIDNIVVEGGTNQGEALRKAREILKNGDNDAKKYLIFFTDGEATTITINDIGINADNSIYKYAQNVYYFYDGKLNSGYKYNGDYVQSQSGNDLMNFHGRNIQNGGFEFSKNGPDIKSFEIKKVNELNYTNESVKYIFFYPNTINGRKMEIATDYAINIGKKLKEEMPNLKVQTIGCALKTDTVSLAKKVNNSMNGTYYSANDESSTEKIFNDLADSILQDYEVKNVSLNLNIPENFEISSDETGFTQTASGYLKSIPNIQYKLNSEKTKYIAEPIYITFKLKAKSVGNISFGSGCKITYNSIKNNSVSTSFPVTTMRIINERFPIIDVKLGSEKMVSYVPNKNMNIIYSIEPKEFSYEDLYGQHLAKDVFILIDSSIAHDVNVGNNIFNKIINTESLMLSKTRYSIITYGNNTSDGIKYINEIADSENIENEGVYVKYIENVLNKADDIGVGNNCKILPALKKVEEITKSGRVDKELTKKIDTNRGSEIREKNIIIVGKKTIDDIDSLTTEAKKLSEDGYKIITLNLGDIQIKDKWKQQGGYLESEEGEVECSNNLKKLHYILSNEYGTTSKTLQERIKDNYFLKISYSQFEEKKKNSQMNQFFSQADNFSLNLLNNEISPKIQFVLSNGFESEVSVDSSFNFNLQDKCSITQNPIYKNNSSSSGLEYKLENLNDITFSIPKIIYRFDYSSSRYIPQLDGKPTVTLTVKLKENLNNTFKFSDESAYFNYKDAIYKMDKRLKLETPTININKELPDLF